MVKDIIEEDVDVTNIPPDDKGIIKLDSIISAIRPNTCLISIAWVNRYIGILNDIKSIGKIACKHRLPFHTDVGIAINTKNVNPIENNITTFSLNMNVIGGPFGSGLLVMKNSLIEGYKIKSMIYGTQNYKLRGGIECIPIIGASMVAYKISQASSYLLKLRKLIISYLKQYFNVCYFGENYIISKRNIIIWKNDTVEVIPNSLLLIITGTTCKDIHQKLKTKKIVVGVVPDYILELLNIPTQLRDVVISITYTYVLTEDNIKLFCKELYHFLSLTYLD